MITKRKHSTQTINIVLFCTISTASYLSKQEPKSSPVFFLISPLEVSIFVSIYLLSNFNRQDLLGVAGVFDLGSTQESNTMIFYVTPSNKDFFKEPLDRYFQKRYDVFVVKRKWNIPHKDGMEMDQFDTEAATHIIWEENGKILGGARLLPTHKPYLLGNLFPELLNYQIPRDPNIWEISQFFIDLPPEFDRTTHPAVRRLFFSIFEFGVKSYGGAKCNIEKDATGSVDFAIAS